MALWQRNFDKNQRQQTMKGIIIEIFNEQHEKMNAQMDTNIYYKVEGTFYRTKGEETNPIEIDETFEDKNPIVAREKAFGYYQSLIDVLLQSKEKEYVCHEKAVSELADFFKSGQEHKLFPDLVDMDDKSLSIYMVKKTPDKFKNAFGETAYQSKWQIHCIDSQFEDGNAYVLKSLIDEYSFYAENGYDCKNYIVKFDTENFFKKRSIQPILQTPLFLDEYKFW
jgi:hypothetical protein